MHRYNLFAHLANRIKRFSLEVEGTINGQKYVALK